MQAQVTPPAFLPVGAMKATRRTGKNRSLPLPTARPAKTYGVTPQVSIPATSQRPSPNECTTEELFQIVMEVAREFRTAKEVVAQHRKYIMRLKTAVFKVRFGSWGCVCPCAATAGKGSLQP